jgi:hypothetical protein
MMVSCDGHAQDELGTASVVSPLDGHHLLTAWAELRERGSRGAGSVVAARPGSLSSSLGRRRPPASSGCLASAIGTR